MDKINKLIYPELSYKINGYIFEVYNKLGPNHLEKYYQKALAKEFSDHNIKYVEQLPVDIKYKDSVIGINYLDFLVDNLIIVEIKAKPFIKKEHFDQVLSYLKISNLKLGIIAAFGKFGVKIYRVLNS